MFVLEVAVVLVAVMADMGDSVACVMDGLGGDDGEVCIS